MDARTMAFLKGQIAHEWGHYLLFCLLGYYDGLGGIEWEASKYGWFGHTSFFWLGESVPKEDMLTILYAGAIAESMYLGKDRRIEYTDAKRVNEFATNKREKIEARKRAKAMLAPCSNIINTLVELTLTKTAFREVNDLNDYYVRVFIDESKEFLLDALNQNMMLHHSEDLAEWLSGNKMKRDIVTMLE